MKIVILITIFYGTQLVCANKSYTQQKVKYEEDA